MDLYQDLKSDENEDSIHKKYQLYNRKNKPLYEKLDNDPKVIIKSKYSQKPRIYYSKKQNEEKRKEISNSENKISNLSNSKSYNKKDYNFSKYISINNKPTNAIQYYNYKSNNASKNANYNINSTLVRYEPPEPNYTPEGVLRGYTNNCSFYVSGSSNLIPKPTIKNKYNNYQKNNYQRINNRINSSYNIYDNKKLNKQSTTPNNFRRRDFLKDSNLSSNNTSENKYSKYNYISNSSKMLYNNSEKIFEKKSNHGYYESSIDQKKILNKFLEKQKEKIPVEYSRKIYFETEPDNNLINHNKRNTDIDKIKQPFIPFNNIKNKEPKPTIINNSNIINNNYKEKIYKSSTNKNIDEKKERNYLLNIEDKKSYSNYRIRNNTPNITRLEIKHTNKIKSINYINNERKTLPEKGIIPNKNEIPHHKGYKYKTIDNNDLNNTEKKYNPKFILNKKNSGNNVNNKNRYNFPETKKKREYGTKTEVHSFNNKYSKSSYNNQEKDNEISTQQNNNNQTNNYGKFEEKNKKIPNYINNRNIISKYGSEGRKYNVKTEIIAYDRKRNRDNEYEVNDIKFFKKQNKNIYSISTEKNYPKIIDPSNRVRSAIYNKKENNSFLRSLININDNKNEIEKDKTNEIIRNDNRRNHTLFVSSNLSKPKRIYKTSTERQVFRSHRYTLGNIDDSDFQKNSKYSKNDENINENYDKKYKKISKYNRDINIDKNYYFNAMKNLEEEIELEDDQEQTEYLPPEHLLKLKQNSNSKENYNYGNINKTQKKPEVKNKYNFSKKDDKNKEVHSEGEYKYYKPHQNNNNHLISQNKKNITNIQRLKNENQNKNEKLSQNNKYIPGKQNQKQIQNNINLKQDQKLIPQIQNQNQLENKINQKYDFQESHQQEEFIEEEHIIKENENEYNDDYEENNENNNLKISKYNSYFGDSNNNYFEVKGISNENNKEENEEGKKNKEKKTFNQQSIQFVRNINFGIQSKNLYIPEDEDKDEKEADEQVIEEDELMDDISDNEEENENKHNMEQIDEENEEKNENYLENDEEGEGEAVGEEIEDNGNEEYDEVEMVIEDKIIEENNPNEEEEINENENES